MLDDVRCYFPNSVFSDFPVYSEHKMVPLLHYCVMLMCMWLFSLA